MSGKQREKKYTRTTKAYKNADFLGSSVARNIRILCEYEVMQQADALQKCAVFRAIRGAVKTWYACLCPRVAANCGVVAFSAGDDDATQAAEGQRCSLNRCSLPVPAARALK